jgi:fermentation-respiration switch protein FrsA (DUF1100 family)
MSNDAGETVEFAGFDGVTLRGRLLLPQGTRGPAPAVVLTNGFSATRAMRLDAFAEAITRAGCATLAYDVRNIGASDGMPRRTVNPWAQMRDSRRAIGWLAERPEIAADRIGLWGCSFSAGQALMLAACDRRVRAVAAIVPFAGIEDVDYRDCQARHRAIREALLDESDTALSVDARVDSGEIAVVSEPGDERRAYLPQPEAAEWFLAHGRAPGASWSNDVRVANAWGTEPRFDPGPCVEFVSPTPLLIVIASRDRLAATDVALRAYERAGEPKRSLLVEGNHFAAFQGEAFEQAARATGDFFAEML